MNNISTSSHPGMGAIPYPGGTAFRIWAPHAGQVFVAGTFNQWSMTANPLASEGNGYWSADILGAKAGDEYKFVILNRAQELWRIDPYARDVTSSVGHAVICNPGFEWGAEVYQMPPAEFAGGFSWGYNPAHIFALESDYGSPDALKQFIKAAHAAGPSPSYRRCGVCCTGLPWPLHWMIFW